MKLNMLHVPKHVQLGRSAAQRLLRAAGSIEDELKLLQNKKMTDRQRGAAQLRFSEKVL